MTPTALARTALALIRHGQDGDYTAFADRLNTLTDDEVRLIVPVLVGINVHAIQIIAEVAPSPAEVGDPVEVVTAAMEDAVLATAAEEEQDNDAGA